MTTNAIAIARNLAAAGVEQKAADAIAEAVVTHSDESFATKTDVANVRNDIVRLEGKIEALAIQIKISIGLSVGLYVALFAFLLGKL